MNTIDVIREFFGWCSVINMGLLLLLVIIMVSLHDRIARIHAKMFNLDEHHVSRIYFQYLAQYKILIIVFNIIPYFALMIMK